MNYKSIHFVRLHMTENAGSIAVILLQMTVTAVIFCFFQGDCRQFLMRDEIYRALGLEKVACLTVSDSDDGLLRQLGDTEGITLLGESRHSLRCVSNTGTLSVTVCPVTPAYARYLENAEGAPIKGNIPTKETPPGMLPAVTSKSLSGTYRVGNTYTLHRDNGTSLVIFVVGALRKDYLFLPPDGTDEGTIIGDISSTILICCNDQTAEQIGGEAIHTAVYTLVAKNRDALSAAEEKIDRETYGYMSVRAAKAEDDARALQEMGTPLVMTALTLILCVANFASYAMLATIRRERELAVCFLCGAAWRQCRQWQLAENVLITAGATGLSCAVGAFLAVRHPTAAHGTAGLLPSAALCTVVMLLSTTTALLRLNRQSPVILIERNV